MSELDRLRFVAGNFYSLQGLRIVPVGVYIVVLALGSFGPQGDLTTSLPAFLLAVLAYYLIGRYYDRTFGRVERTAADRRLDLLTMAAALGIIVAGSALDAWGRWPVYGTGLGLAGFLLVIHLRAGGTYRVYYAVLAALLAAASLSPLVFGWPVGGVSRWVLAGVGAAYVIGGRLDHWQLARSLKPAV